MDPNPALPGLLSDDAVLDRIAQRTAARFTGVFSEQTVHRHVRDAYRALTRTAHVTTHLAVVTERFATEQLTAVAQVQGRLPKPRYEVLFVCDHNAGRSQIAAALLRHLAGELVNVRSAGSAPAGGFDPTVARAVQELGADLDEDYPKPLTDAVVQAADVVVTMGCGDACPVYPGKRYLDWNVSDPLGRSLNEVRAIRNAIDVRVRKLAAELRAD
ncbi:protein-tyrosine-phosphatase [Lipingzhangella halophila]|uniref:Protein-tyrosine-phosphatase n=1 Tax=Lipingzhangella halophila TaxID=1783352 RepID=A0A7W7RF38_9ACTN|nr:arsenate reductase ArsC [Lipingzhangella halophila]MBB4930759.1 protein-tyrosine-phosphatase [Lipingzhangella halophila]